MHPTPANGPRGKKPGTIIPCLLLFSLIRAEILEGAPDNVVGTVTENGRTLKFTSNSGFEMEKDAV
jgi:hypothetical protein